MKRQKSLHDIVEQGHRLLLEGGDSQTSFDPWRGIRYKRILDIYNRYVKNIISYHKLHSAEHAFNKVNVNVPIDKEIYSK